MDARRHETPRAPTIASCDPVALERNRACMLVVDMLGHRTRLRAPPQRGEQRIDQEARPNRDDAIVPSADRCSQLARVGAAAAWLVVKMGAVNCCAKNSRKEPRAGAPEPEDAKQALGGADRFDAASVRNVHASTPDVRHGMTQGTMSSRERSMAPSPNMRSSSLPRAPKFSA
jgi:hypothetical protein